MALLAPCITSITRSRTPEPRLRSARWSGSSYASGETEYTRFAMRDMLEQRACDILMPDLQRAGGLTEMRRIAALAHAYNTPISTHIFTEQSLCIAGSSANCMSVEHMPWVSQLFNETMELEDGELIIPQRPGTGFTFNSDAVNAYRLTT